MLTFLFEPSSTLYAVLLEMSRISAEMTFAIFSSGFWLRTRQSLMVLYPFHVSLQLSLKLLDSSHNEHPREFSSTSILRDLSLATIFVISITCSCIVREPSNFMVVSVLINVPTRDLSKVWERSSINFLNSCTLSILGRATLMLLAMLIHINIYIKSSQGNSTH